MKKLFFIISIILLTISCKAQVYSLQDYVSSTNVPQNSYIKDSYNDFNLYEGTWKYQDSSIELDLTFQKKIMYFDSETNVSEDYLIGEYKFFENDNLIINTLNNLNLNLNPFDYNISASMFIRNSSFPNCNDCTINDRRIKLVFSDPDRPWVQAYIVLRHKVIAGTEYIDATIYESSTLVPDDTTPSSLRVPVGNYLLVKQ